LASLHPSPDKPDPQATSGRHRYHQTILYPVTLTMTTTLIVGDVKSSSSSPAGMKSLCRILRVFFFIMFFVVYINFDQQLVTTMTRLVETTSNQQQQQQHRQHVDEEQDTAIIITSSWIPSHPSTFLIDSVLNSTRRHLIGLSPSAPIFITVDPIPTSTSSPSEERVEKLEQYIINLYQQHLTHSHVHVLPSVQHLHIGGSVMKALQLIEVHYPRVQYVYSLQHDFPFSKDVDHVALRNVMETYPEKVNWIRFPKRNPYSLNPGCGSEETIWYNKTFPTSIATATTTTTAETTAETTTIEFTNITTNDTSNSNTSATIIPSHQDPMQLQLIPTSAYSDNNHLARFDWYKETLASLVMLTRPPEFPLQGRANTACHEDKSIGLYIYHEVCLEHLDGRHSTDVGGR